MASCRLQTKSQEDQIKELNKFHAVWGYYKYKFMDEGRVVSLDENRITTSEGQGYALLRAAWAGDKQAFDETWKWTQTHLQRDDALFSWKWKGKILDPNSATDADTDIALALILASRRFDDERYLRLAQPILDAIWEKEILVVDGRYFVTAGDWAQNEEISPLHVAYYAPYAYRIFQDVDPSRPWIKLTEASYELITWLYRTQKVKVPPEIIYLDSESGELSLDHPQTGQQHDFGYDAFPLFWRFALDYTWKTKWAGPQKSLMLDFFMDEWDKRGAFYDAYRVDGRRLSNLEALPLYATIHTLALTENRRFAQKIRDSKLIPLWNKAKRDPPLPYYLSNWLWFDRAVHLREAKRYDEVLVFLSAHDLSTFLNHFPLIPVLVFILLFMLSRVHWTIKTTGLVVGAYLIVRYLTWRIFYTTNFIEPLGPAISIGLLMAELYCVVTVMFFLVQVGVKDEKPIKSTTLDLNYNPNVDVFFPIYNEPASILEKSLIGATAIQYDNKKIFVFDDSHRDEIKKLAESYGATYIKGPQKKSKAENLNRGLQHSSGELVAILDVDHIPLHNFLKETVPAFTDKNVGFVQAPHHFYNKDIFQRSFQTKGKMPAEQDFFHHAIQKGRGNWNGAYFVGSVAVFRRSTLDSINGFKSQTVTEDIHTSQHIHAKGWKSIFVSKILAVGLHPEDLRSYTIQRRRWMMGHLQLFFSDNPLFCKGLSLRQRLGYFSSLNYFFFPIMRAILCVTPLYYLFFHMHPIIGNFNILMAHLIPFLIAVPLSSSMIVAKWPRLFWSDVYETLVALPLLGSMFKAFTPKSKEFEVTPKGRGVQTRRFDWATAGSSVFVAGLLSLAIVKGMYEYLYYGIEKEAYFFNLLWAGLTLFILGVSLLMAWEKPQVRGEPRIRRPIPYKLKKEGHVLFEGNLMDISLSGIAFKSTDLDERLPEVGELILSAGKQITLQAQLVFHDQVAPGVVKAGYKFIEIKKETYQDLVKYVLASPETWDRSFSEKAEKQSTAFLLLFQGLWALVKKAQDRRRRTPRRSTLAWDSLQLQRQQRRVLVTDLSREGLGLLAFGANNPYSDWIKAGARVLQGRNVKPVFTRRVAPYVWRLGCKMVAK